MMIKITLVNVEGKEFKVYANLPEGFNVADVDLEFVGNNLVRLVVRDENDVEGEVSFRLPDDFDCIAEARAEFVDEKDEEDRDVEADEEFESEYFCGCDNMKDLKKLHRQWSMKLHPDRGGNAAEFRVMQEEYESLKKAFSKQPAYAC